MRECRIVGGETETEGDVRVRGGRIAAVAPSLSAAAGETVVEGRGRLLFPGLMDDQVHFREPGLTAKADIFSESRAAAAGGITSFMEMPNVIPPTLTMERLEDKRAIAAKHSLVNYGFYLGASRNNIADIAAADPRRIAGVKIFMGSSTGDMLVDDEKVLEKIFSESPTLIATHCESTPRILRRLEEAKKKFGGNIPAEAHPEIRDTEACYESSSRAVALAKKTGARLHILHITSARELSLFAPGDSSKKQITAEACVHHLLFDDRDYAALGMRLKANPAVKTAADKSALRAAVAEGRIDVLATDHAPHLLAEKELPYEKAAAGMPLAEYALPAFLELAAEGALTYSQIAHRAAAAVADMFAIADRGRIAEGCWADFVLVSRLPEGAPPRKKLLSKCGWTPFAARRFAHQVDATFVNGVLVWDGQAIQNAAAARPLEFNR